MISFYPGPSRVYRQIPDYVKDAYQEGVLSINHRSPEFMAMAENTIVLLKEKLEIPEDYWIFFTSSATECWEIISQSLVQKKSFHIYNGAFGKKWWQYAQKLQTEATGYEFSVNEVLNTESLKVDNDAEVICITQNETSNGTAVSNPAIGKIRNKFPNSLIAVDATSSMAGVYLDFALADVWFASVQKCFGLPAGMGVMVCSPKAIEKAKTLGENNHYNSLVFMIENMQRYQTTHTPNVLGVYLLMRSMEESGAIHQTEKILNNRYKEYKGVFSGSEKVKWLVKNPSVRSVTVITLEGNSQHLKKIKEDAKSAGIMVGNGYGAWKENTFRIANFPAIEAEEIEILKQFIVPYL